MPFKKTFLLLPVVVLSAAFSDAQTILTYEFTNSSATQSATLTGSNPAIAASDFSLVGLGNFGGNPG